MRGGFDPALFGARGDGLHADGPAIQAAIDEAGGRGGGVVSLGPGTWLTGALFLRSGVELALGRGSVLLASEDPADYPIFEARWEGLSQRAHAPLISGRGLRNIALTGGGLVDGRGAQWWRRFREGGLEAPRPRLVSFSDCEDVLIEGLSFVDSPSWTINPVRCTRLRVRGITIRNPADSPNTDGINPDSCQSVLIEGCFISVGDDCITLKSGNEAEPEALRPPCRDIVITNCILEAGHGGIVIGSEMSGGVRDVLVSNCLMRGTDRGIRIKTRRGRGGVVEDLRFSDLLMEDVACPIAINMRYHCGAKGDPLVSDRRPRPVDAGTPRIRRLGIAGLRARGAKTAAVWIEGLPESPVEGLELRDVSIGLAAEEGAGPPSLPEMADGLEPLTRRGLIARQARGLRLEGLRISGQAGAALLFEEGVEAVVDGRAPGGAMGAGGAVDNAMGAGGASA
jgi:polygalacturonase